MSLTSPFSCVSDAFPFYRFVCFLIHYIFCHQTNQVFLMTSLINFCLTLDPLVRTIFALFLCSLMSLLVVLVFWVLMFLHHRSRVQRWYFCVCCFCTNTSQVQRCSTPWNVLVLKFLIFFPNLKISFMVIVVVRLCLAHSNRCSFTNNMIMCASMGTIWRPLDYGIWGTETTSCIQFINSWDPQINEFWCQDLYRICHEVNPTAYVEIPDGTFREFVTKYLAENGRWIQIIGELYVNGSVQFFIFWPILGKRVAVYLQPTGSNWGHMVG